MLRSAILILLFLVSAVAFGQNRDDAPFNSLQSSTLAVLPDLGDGEPNLGVAGPLVGVHGNRLLIGGGANFPDGAPWQGGSRVYHDRIYVLAKVGSTYECSLTDRRLPFPVAYSANASSADGVYCVGGENAEGRLDSVLRLTWSSGEVKVEQLPRLPFPLSNAAAAIIGKTLYVVGGETNTGPSDRLLALQWDAKSGPAWQELPSMPRQASHLTAVSQSDGDRHRLYVFGGRAKLPEDERTPFFDSVYSYSPYTNVWQTHAPMPNPAAAGTAVPVGYGFVIVCPAAHQEFYNENEHLNTIRAAAENEEERIRLQKEYAKRIDDFAGFPSDIYSYSTITDTWTRLGSLDFATPVTTTAIRFDGKIVFPTGETKPALRTPKINALEIHSAKKGFGYINYTVIVAYLIVLVIIGFVFSSRNKDTGDFFRGGGRIPWWAMGISIFATALSSVTFLSMPAKAFATDWRMLCYNLGILFVAPIVVAYYLPYFRILNLSTAYEYLEKRFNYFCRAVASGLFCLFMIARFAVILLLASLALNAVMDMNVILCILVMGVITIIYCTMGGMEAVVWSDVVQTAIFVFGVLFCLVFLIFQTDGGMVGFLSTGYSMNKLHTFEFRWDIAQPMFVFVILGGFANSLITYSSDQAIIQRYMSTKNHSQAVKSIWFNAILSIPITLVFFMVGTALFTYYRSHPQLFDVMQDKVDSIFPHYIVNTLPTGFVGLLIAAIFAAAMSTLSSNINSFSAAITEDFVKKACPTLSARRGLWTARLTSALAGILGTGAAIWLAFSPTTSLWDQFNTFLGLLMSGIGGLFLMGVFSKRINGFGAICGLCGSLVIILWIQQATSLSFLMYGVIGMPACYGIGWLASAITGFANVKEGVPQETNN